MAWPTHWTSALGDGEGQGSLEGCMQSMGSQRVGHDLTTEQDCSVSNEHTTLVHKINFNKSLSYKILKLFTQYFWESFEPHKCYVDKAITKVMKLELNHSRKSDILINPDSYFNEYQIQSIHPTREKLLKFKCSYWDFPLCSNIF